MGNDVLNLLIIQAEFRHSRIHYLKTYYIWRFKKFNTI